MPEISNAELAEELRRLKLANSNKLLKINNIIASDPEIGDIKKKIQISYLSQERAKQWADKQVRTLEEKAADSLLEANMLAEVEQAKRK